MCGVVVFRPLTHSRTHTRKSVSHSFTHSFISRHCIASVHRTATKRQATPLRKRSEQRHGASDELAALTRSLTHSLSHAPQAPAAGQRSAGSNPSITTPPPRTCHSLTHSLKHTMWKCATNTRRLITTNSAPPHHHSLTRLLLHFHFHFHFHPHFHHSGPP